MNTLFKWPGVLILILAFTSGFAYALPISSTDLWQEAPITGKSSTHHVGPMEGLFDGNEGGYGYETGNALFADSGSHDGLTHWVEWSTSESVTLRSLNLIAYHDFDDRNINHRGFSEFSLYYKDVSSWLEAFNWLYDDPGHDQHYGGGPSYSFAPDPHDMNRSYLELTANLDLPVTAQFFRAEFTQQGNSGGPRIVELDGYDTLQNIPEPATLVLLGAGLVGLGFSHRRN